MFDLPRNHGIAHYSHTVGICNHDGAVQETGIVDPCGPGHLAIAVQSEPGGKHSVIGMFAARMDGSNPGADWAFSNLKLAFP